MNNWQKFRLAFGLVAGLWFLAIALTAGVRWNVQQLGPLGDAMAPLVLGAAFVTLWLTIEERTEGRHEIIALIRSQQNANELTAINSFADKMLLAIMNVEALLVTYGDSAPAGTPHEITSVNAKAVLDHLRLWKADLEKLADSMSESDTEEQRTTRRKVVAGLKEQANVLIESADRAHVAHLAFAGRKRRGDA